ncbi:glycosyltransferase family 2 protein [Paenibacillus sp. sgz500958]|uniref:glycosyltransferase family 2 protein n=1 Tax=Paenibacillus sp. sgz500958 TaxID=3242475 RepID=UPI0036D34C08
MTTLTVFTPTYNRAYCLNVLYDSLVRQTNQDFEWLIVDDGSSDHTPELVESWLKDSRIAIRYVRQKNQGMHGAHNTAFENIHTELNVCIDSDDYMPDDAVEKIISFWREKGSEEVSGFIALDSYFNGDIIGNLLPENLEKATLFDLYYKHGVWGDKKLVYRTAVIKDYPYPLFEGENYVGLAYKWFWLDTHFELLILNEVLCCVEYLDDGSTRNMFRQYRKNPRGFAFYRTELMKLPFADLKFKYRQAIHYNSSSMFSRNGRMLTESPEKLLTILAFPPGLLLHLYILYKTKNMNRKG